MNSRQFWCLRLSEPLASRNDDRPAGLCSDVDEAAEVLSEGWSITNSEELISTLEWLRDEGHRGRFQQQLQKTEPHCFLAWDLARLAQLVRWGVRAGYLQVESAWRWLEIAGDQAAAGFSSWNSYLDDYEAGFRAWTEDEDEARRVADHVLRLKGETLPAWAPPQQPRLSPLKHRFRSFWLKTSTSACVRSLFIFVLLAVASLLSPWPLGATVGCTTLLTLVASPILWGPVVEGLLALMGLGLVTLSFVGGFFRESVPKDWETSLACLLFAALTFYTLAYFLAYSDDRTPAAA